MKFSDTVVEDYQLMTRLGTTPKRSYSVNKSCHHQNYRLYRTSCTPFFREIDPTHPMEARRETPQEALGNVEGKQRKKTAKHVIEVAGFASVGHSRGRHASLRGLFLTDR
jgi:hypothetical protein